MKGKCNETYDNKEVIHYIYLLKEREFIKTNEPIYKVGKSKQMNLSRFSQYPNGSILYIQMVVPNCDKLERIILHKFKRKYIQRADIGTEYFEGDFNSMVDDVFWEVYDYKVRMKNPIVESENENDTKKVYTFDFDKFKCV